MVRMYLCIYFFCTDTTTNENGMNIFQKVLSGEQKK